MCGTKGKNQLKLLKINLWTFGPFQLPSYVASPEQIRVKNVFWLHNRQVHCELNLGMLLFILPPLFLCHASGG